MLSEDPELQTLLAEEELRQRESLELIASENFTSPAVRACLGSVLTNKYSEGLPGKRYYGGNEVIDKIELLCQKRALSAFGLEESEWSVNVQPYSGSPANLAVYTALLEPGDRILGMNLTSGGHLSHGHKTATKKISACSIFFETFSYGVREDGWIDYEEVEQKALEHKPKLIICGGSSYPRDLEYEKFRAIATRVGAYLMADIAHISGLVASKTLANPFAYCDVVTSTTHKTLRGPRSGMIFCKKELEQQINSAVFPALQGGPHNHQIAALATQFREVQTPAFREYIQEVQLHAKYLGERLKEQGFELATKGTDTHLLSISLRNFDITGSKMERVCELVNISLNKNYFPGDKPPFASTGIRIGTACMVTRKLPLEAWDKIAEWLRACALFCQERQVRLGRKLVAWNKGIEEEPFVKQLKEEVRIMAKELHFP